MQAHDRNRLRLAGLALMLGLASCRHSPGVVEAKTGAAPGIARSHAKTLNRLVIKLYSGSSTGLVVGAGPGDTNPAAQLTNLSFVENPGLANTYIWAFTDGATLLDSQCHAMTRTAAINVANAPGSNSIIFVDALGADGKSVAPPMVQIWARDSGAVADCQSGEGP